MRKLSTKKAVAVIGVAALATTGSGIAYAYWTTSGTGAGSATAGDAVAWDVTTTNASTSAQALTPGGPTQTVKIRIQNDGTGSQRLSSVVVSVAGAAAAPWSSGTCGADDFTVGTPQFTAGDVAPAAVVDGTVTIQMKNLDENQDDCKGVIVPLHVVAS